MPPATGPDVLPLEARQLQQQLAELGAGHLLTQQWRHQGGHRPQAAGPEGALAEATKLEAAQQQHGKQHSAGGLGHQRKGTMAPTCLGTTTVPGKPITNAVADGLMVDGLMADVNNPCH